MRVRLEPITTEHARLLGALVRDPDVLRFTYVPDPPPADFAEYWVSLYEPGTGRHGFAAYADDGTFVGVGLVPHLDRDSLEAEIGYIVAPEARGRGAGQAILRAVTDWVFAQGAQRIRLLIQPDNAASLGVAAAAGYHREGVMRSVHFKQGRRTDLVLLSRLPSDP